MQNLEKNFYELNTLGFTIVKNAVPKEQLPALKEHLRQAVLLDNERYLGRPQKHKALVDNLAAYGRPFLELVDDETIQAVFAKYLGETCILYSYTSTILPPNEHVPASDMHVDTPRLIPNYWSAMVMTVALDDFTAANGASWYLPGSHTCETRPSDETFAKYAVQVSRGAGDVLFFNPRVFHKAGVNTTKEVRYALGCYAVRSFMKPRFDFARMIPMSELTWATERLQRFLGHHTRVPANMDDYYVPGEKRLYRANQG